MKVNPVKQNEHPKYPKKQDFDAMLLGNVPKRWAGSTAAKVALGALAVASLTGCAVVRPINSPIVTDGTVIATPTPTDIVYAGVPMPATLNVAPLFLHGEGRGSFGCVMVAPPVFLSEDDALAVINEAAKEYGLQFSGKDSPELSNVLQPAMDLSPQSDDNPKRTETPDTIITLKTDFADAEHGVAIEFVSVEDVREWTVWPSGASVEQYDTKDAADQLSDALEQAIPDDYNYNEIGVLYDPCEFSEDETEALAMTQEQLKAQAKDFFEWLKSQGVI